MTHEDQKLIEEKVPEIVEYAIKIKGFTEKDITEENIENLFHEWLESQRKFHEKVMNMSDKEKVAIGREMIK